MTTAAAERKKWLSRQLRDNNSVLILVVLLLLAFTVVEGFSISFYQAILTSAEYGLVALGLGFVMMTGNIDLSLGYLATSCGVTMVTAFNAIYALTGSDIVALLVGVLAALVLGALLGALNGTLVTKIGIAPVIATIAPNFLFVGYVLQFAADKYVPTTASLVKVIGQKTLLGIKWLTPMTIIFVVLVAIAGLWMYMTRFGNSLKLVGDNTEAARFAGINDKRVVFMAYVLAGVMCGAAGFIMVSYSGGAIYTQGVALGTLPIACCVLGGIKMTGGKGTTAHILIGVLLMRILSQVLRAMHLLTAYVNLITGLLLVVILLIDRFTSVKKAD